MTSTVPVAASSLAGGDAELRLPLRIAPPRELPSSVVQVAKRAFATRFLERLGVTADDRNIAMILAKLQMSRANMELEHSGASKTPEAIAVGSRKLAGRQRGKRSPIRRRQRGQPPHPQQTQQREQDGQPPPEQMKRLRQRRQSIFATPAPPSPQSSGTEPAVTDAGSTGETGSTHTVGADGRKVSFTGTGSGSQASPFPSAGGSSGTTAAASQASSSSAAAAAARRRPSPFASVSSATQAGGGGGGGGGAGAASGGGELSTGDGTHSARSPPRGPDARFSSADVFGETAADIERTGAGAGDSDVRPSASDHDLETRFRGRYWQDELPALLREPAGALHSPPPLCEPTRGMDLVKAFVYAFPYSSVCPPTTLLTQAQFRRHVLRMPFVHCAVDLALHAYWSTLGAAQLPALAQAKCRSYYVRFVEHCRAVFPKPVVHRPQELALLPLMLCALRTVANILVMTPLSMAQRLAFGESVFTHIDGVVREVLDPVDLFAHSLIALDGLASGAHRIRKAEHRKFMTSLALEALTEGTTNRKGWDPDAVRDNVRALSPPLRGRLASAFEWHRRSWSASPPGGRATDAPSLPPVSPPRDPPRRLAVHHTDDGVIPLDLSAALASRGPSPHHAGPAGPSRSPPALPSRRAQQTPAPAAAAAESFPERLRTDIRAAVEASQKRRMFAAATYHPGRPLAPASLPSPAARDRLRGSAADGGPAARTPAPASGGIGVDPDVAARSGVAVDVSGDTDAVADTDRIASDDAESESSSSPGAPPTVGKPVMPPPLVMGSGPPTARPAAASGTLVGAPLVSHEEADELLRRRLHWREVFLLERLLRRVLRIPTYTVPIPRVRRGRVPQRWRRSEYHSLLEQARATVEESRRARQLADLGALPDDSDSAAVGTSSDRDAGGGAGAADRDVHRGVTEATVPSPPAPGPPSGHEPVAASIPRP